MSKRDLLLEIGTEEIPAASVVIGQNQLAERAANLFDRYRLDYEVISTYGAPRRLALVIGGLDERQSKAIFEVKGPARKAAFTPEGTPTKAAEGFARSQGVSIKGLITRVVDSGEYVFAIKEEEGQETADILVAILPELILSLSFPKSMRWGDRDTRFVRPIRWIVALFGNDVISFEVNGIKSGRDTLGHRLLAENPISINAPCDYFEDLIKHKVIVDPEKRADMMKSEIERAVKDTGGRAVVHKHTFDEVLELAEYPHAIRGSFSNEFVKLPREVLVTAMEAHQRYFPVEDMQGKLLPNFIVIQNGDPEYADIIRKGHERVIRARLSDAKFFFETDGSKPLESYVDKLKGVTFQVKLGTVFQKTERIVKLAGDIATRLGLSQQDIEFSARAAYLCKADLVTEMVGEFPTLQGVMGMEYARVSGEPEAIAVAIFEHYLPRSAGDILPQTTIGQVASIADKLDSIAGIIAAGLLPTSSEDPYALRRQAYGIVSIILDNDLSIPMKVMIDTTLSLYEKQGVKFDPLETARLVEDFIRGRLRAYLLTQDLPVDAIEAVGAMSIEDMVDIRRRARAIAEKLDSSEMADLLVAFIRCKNLAKPAIGIQIDTGLLQEAYEKDLHKVAVEVDKDLSNANGNYTLAIDILARLKGPVDSFFDNVLVMAEDEAVRNNRIRLLNYCLAEFLRIADFSKITSPS